MTPETFRAIRVAADMSLADVADHLRVTKRHVRMLEAGDRSVSGPIAVLMEMLAENTTSD